jgi:hypothetical protein
LRKLSLLICAVFAFAACARAQSQTSQPQASPTTQASQTQASQTQPSQTQPSQTQDSQAQAPKKIQFSQIDVAAGGSTFFSQQSTSSSQAFIEPALKGGLYPALTFDVLLKNNFGFYAEGTFRDHEGLYDEYQKFRPIFYDINGVYSHKVILKGTFDFYGGVGGESLIFYNEFFSCPTDSCRAQVSANHLLLHAGVGFRYYPWLRRRLFLRPEAHYYRIIDNTEFNSGNFLRLGASVGYTFK